MSAVQEAATPPAGADEPRIVLRDVSWQFYESLLREVGRRPALRLTYDRGCLELMTISQLHDRYKCILDRLIFALALELGMKIRSGGSATFRRADLERGLEPDACYWTAREPLIRHLHTVDLSRDPSFDLAIEVEMSRSALDRVAIYSALGVPEWWRFDGDVLRGFRLGENGAYTSAEESHVFPRLPVDGLVPFVHQGLNLDETELFRAFTAWVQQWCNET